MKDINKVLNGINYTFYNRTRLNKVASIEYDSRKCKNNSMFVCIKGFEADGHDYIEHAVNNGANFILIENKSKVDFNRYDLKSITFIESTNNRENLTILSKNFYGNPSEAINLIGVTGTNGKTSVTKIISDIYEGLAIKCGVIGTINNQIGNEIMSSSNTTPESVEINKMLNQAIKENIKNVTMEVSSHAVDLKRVNGLAFDVGIFTNLTEDHLDYHQTMEEYFKIKEKFIKKSLYKVINFDDPYGKRILKASDNKYITYGLSDDADLYAENIKNIEYGLSFDVVYKKSVINVKTQLFGNINVYNILAAIGAFLQLGYELSDLKKGLKNIKNVPGRLEYVPNNKGIKVLVDYAHTPDALEKVINICRDFTDKKITTVFGCGGNRDKAKRPMMGKIAVNLSDQVIITNDNPRNESPEKIIEDILEGVQLDNYKVIMDRKLAIVEAIKTSNQGDTVLIAGKGHETYQIIGDTKEAFDDRLIAKHALKDGFNG